MASRNYRLAHWRDLLIELVARDLKVRYQRSALGLGWSLLKPLSQLAIFAIVFTSVLPLDIPNYTTFVFTGVLVWAWFGSSLTSAIVSITGNRELVRRPGFPTRLLPALAILSNGVHFLLALPLLLISSIIQTGGPGLSIVALPAVILAQFVLMLAFSMLLAALHVFFRDLEHLATIAIMLGFYITPVFYRPLQADHDYAFLSDYNPMAWILSAYRSILVHGLFPETVFFLKILAVSLPVLAVGTWFFNRVSAKFVDEI